MLKMVDGTGIIGVDMICPLGVSTPQPPNYDRVELEGAGMLVLPNSLDAPLERFELGGKTEQVQEPSPSPEYPQEIKSAGRKSKNLFDAKKAKSGWITTDGKQTLATLGNIDNVVSDYIQVYSGMKYASSVGVYKYFYDSEKIFLKRDASVSSSIVIPDNAKYMIVIAPVNKALAIQTANTLMINIGSSVLPYEQYADKKLFDVKVTGKNLFDREKAKDNSNWIFKDGDGYAKFPIYVKKGNKITFSYTEKLTTGKNFYLGIAQSEAGSVVAWLYHSANLSVSNNKYTIVAVGDYMYLMCNGSNIQTFLDVIQTLQVEISPTQTDYAPYTEQTLTLTSDRPITKWDKLVEQGGQIGWLYGGKIIDSYNSELIDTEYMSSTGSLTVGATVLYKLKEPEFVPLPQPEQNAIRALKTYYPTTVITADGGELDPDIKVTYRKEI